MNQSELEANACNRRQARKNACERNLVPRVLWLFGQRVGASRDSGEFETNYIF